MWVVSYGAVSGREAAVELTGTYSQRVPQGSTRIAPALARIILVLSFNEFTSTCHLTVVAWILFATFVASYGFSTEVV